MAEHRKKIKVDLIRRMCGNSISISVWFVNKYNKIYEKQVRKLVKTSKELKKSIMQLKQKHDESVAALKKRIKEEQMDIKNIESKMHQIHQLAFVKEAADAVVCEEPSESEQSDSEQSDIDENHDNRNV